MTKILIVIAIAILILLLERKLFTAEKSTKERILFIVLLLIGIGFNIVLCLNRAFPLLLGWLKVVYGAISNVWYG